MLSEISIERRKLPQNFDQSRIHLVLEDIEVALLDKAGVHATAYADSICILIKVPTNNLLDAATALTEMKLI